MPKLYLGIFSLLFLFIFSSCKDEVNPLQTTTTGLLKLNIDKENVPTNVFYVKATLTRQNYNDVTSIININDDYSTNININNIAVGEWHLKVEAYDSIMTLKYDGESDVTINEASLTEVQLSLSPVGSGMGNIYIKVAWGSSPYVTSISIYPSFPVIAVSSFPGTEPRNQQSAVFYENGKYKMWVCVQDTGAAVNIFYAESPDGIKWTFNLSPVFRNATLQTIMKDGDTYRMYYLGTVNGEYGNCCATSTDGLNWTNEKNVYILGGESPIVTTLSVLKINNKFHLYYASSKNSTIYVVTSEDGVNFKDNQLLKFSSTFDFGYYDRLFRIIDDNGRYMAIHNTDAFATSIDGINWQVDNTYCHKYIANESPHVTFPCFVKINNKYYRMYFTGWDDLFHTAGLGFFELGFK